MLKIETPVNEIPGIKSLRTVILRIEILKNESS